MFAESGRRSRSGKVDSTTYPAGCNRMLRMAKKNTEPHKEQRSKPNESERQHRSERGEKALKEFSEMNKMVEGCDFSATCRMQSENGVIIAGRSR